MKKLCGLLALGFVFLIPGISSADPANGQISNFVFTYTFGSTPTTDRFDVTGTYVLGSGNNGIHLPADAVTVNFDNGRFVQTIPSNSFSAISGGYRYLSTNPGITQVKIMNNGQITVQVRNSNFTGSSPARFGAFSLTVGDDVFTAIPNSVPVAKIVGESTAEVGSLLTLDGTESSDFNSNSLSYTWAIVSQPLGSNVSLSSTTNATTSFTPTTNGAYVIRLTPNDGIANGVPALITINASGGNEDPPAPPSPNNGLISLHTDKESYIVGDTALLTLSEDAAPGNGTDRWFFRATLNDAPITLTAVPNSNDNTFTTPAFAEAGSQEFKVDLYLENTNLAKGLATAITAFNTEITAINAALLYEQDPLIIAQLLAQKDYDLEQIANAQDQLEQNRTKVGETAVLSFSVDQ